MPEIAVLNGGDIDRSNLFEYCYNNPVNYTDRNGLFAVSAFLGTVIAGAIVGAAFSALNAYITGEQITFEKILLGAAVGAACAAITAFAAFPSSYAAGVLATSTNTAKTVLSIGSVAVNSMLAFAVSDSTGSTNRESTLSACGAGIATLAGLLIPEVSFGFNLLTSLAVGGTVELSFSCLRLTRDLDSSIIYTGNKGGRNQKKNLFGKGINNTRTTRGSNKMIAYVTAF